MGYNLINKENNMKDLIDLEFIKNLDLRLESTLSNFEENYSDFSGTLKEFLELDKLRYLQKTDVVYKIVDYDILKKWAVDCATYIVDNYSKNNDTKEHLSVIKKVLSNQLPKEKANVLATKLREEKKNLSTKDSTEGRILSTLFAAADTVGFDYIDNADFSKTLAELYVTGAEDNAIWVAAFEEGLDHRESTKARKKQQTINLKLLIDLL